MLNLNKKGLRIFDEFQIDFQLPKWIERHKNSTAIQTEANMRNLLIASRIEMRGGLSPIPESWAGESDDQTPMPQTRVFANATAGPISAPYVDSKKPSLFDFLFKRKPKPVVAEELQNFTINTLPEPMLLKKEDGAELTVQDFFASIKNDIKETELATERTKNYILGLEYLKKTGQTSLMEKMEAHIEIHRAETQCYALGLTKSITEEQVVEFAKKTERGLKLDWIKNFARQIPEKVVAVKQKADENLLFDNYVIMHYDPDNKGSQETAKEKIASDAKKRDPILFGLIFGSTKLYYCGDWIDDHCDLTFDKLVEKLGEDAIKANDISAHVLKVSE